MSAATLELRGEPLACALAALALLRRDPGAELALDLGRLAAAEGELVGIVRADDALLDCAARIWPGYVVREGGQARQLEAPVALIDPVLCLAVLAGRVEDRPAGRAPGGPVRHVGSADRIVAPSRQLMSPAHDIALPVAWEGEAGGSDYDQYLPCGPGLVMVRRRRAVAPGPWSVIARLARGGDWR